MKQSKQGLYTLLISAWFLLPACASTADEPVEAEDADLSSACVGSACATLALPKALSAGLAVVNNRLFWIGEGPLTGTLGEHAPVLQHCELPACSVVGTLPLQPDLTLSVPFHVYGLRAAGDRVFFVMAPHTDGGASAGQNFYLTDGISLNIVHSGFPASRGHYAADAKGFVAYTYDRKLDGWDKSYLYGCAFDGGKTRDCRSVTFSSGLSLGEFALTPTKLVGVGTGQLFWFDRSSFGHVVGPSLSTSTIGIFTAGEHAISGRIGTRTLPSGEAEHDMQFEVASFETGRRWGIPGVATGSAQDGTSLYVGTYGEGDVWDVNGVGVIAKLTPEKPRARILAKAQNARGVALSENRIYWLEQLPVRSTGETKHHVVRHTAK
jgi:hypothetical protein